MAQPKINDACMIDWQFRYDEPTKLWVIWRRDNTGGVIQAMHLETDCPVQYQGLMHYCRAELLVEGATNKGSSVTCSRAKLRTLVLQEQVVHVPKIELTGTVMQPGG